MTCFSLGFYFPRPNIDGLVKSQNLDGKVGARSPCPYIRCKARNPAQSGTEEVYLQVRRNDEGEAQSREARDRWTFYEAINICRASFAVATSRSIRLAISTTFLTISALVLAKTFF